MRPLLRREPKRGRGLTLSLAINAFFILAKYKHFERAWGPKKRIPSLYSEIESFSASKGLE